MRRRSLLAAAATAVLTGATAVPAADAVVIERAAGPPLTFTVEVAATPQARARGLMFRESLPERHGMLFDFHVEQPVAFWMRNTLIPLDLLFLDRAGRIVGIHANARPLSEDLIPSRVPVRAVLEIRGGASAELGIAVGDRVRHPIFAEG